MDQSGSQSKLRTRSPTSQRRYTSGCNLTHDPTSVGRLLGIKGKCLERAMATLEGIGDATTFGILDEEVMLWQSMPTEAMVARGVLPPIAPPMLG